jgi:hypothetical protein
MQTPAMNSQLLLRALALVLVALSLALPPFTRAADAPRDAQTVMNGMRLKKWTKDLQLTDEQQKKVQAFLDEEGKEVAKLDQDSSLDINSRRAKVDDLRKATYAKIKPVLTAPQLETFEKSLAKMQPKKK